MAGWSSKAEIGRPGNVASSRAKASARLGMAKRVIPRAIVAASATPMMPNVITTASGGAAAAKPKANSANASMAMVQTGQKVRVARSAVMAARVMRNGQIRRVSAGVLGLVLVMVPFGGGLPRGPIPTRELYLGL